MELLMKRVLLTAGVLALFSVTVVAAPADKTGHKSPAPGTNSETMSAAEDTTAGAVGAISAEMTRTTKGFATAAAISDMYEVTAGKIALQRSSEADIKKFAQKMVDAHTATTEKLKGLLPSGITPPAHVDSRRQGMLDNLRGASGADFDHRYAVQQVAAHKEADILMRGYAKDGDNAGIKGFARDTDKDVKMHLSMAQRLEKQYK
jgi:putative membrane protein